MAITVGAVYVDILPSAAKFAAEVEKEVAPQVETLGKSIGEQIGKALSKAIGDSIPKAVTDGVKESSKATPEAAKKGKQVGGAFAKTFKAEITAAANSLPKFKITSDSTDVQKDIAKIRKDLETLGKKKIGINLSAEDGFAQVAALRARLEALRGQTIDIDFDVDKALGSLGQLQVGLTGLQTKLDDAFRDRQGDFARSLRGAIDSAVRSLPDIKLGSDITGVEADLATVRARLTELGTYHVDVDISAADAMAELTELEAMLLAIGRSTTNVRVRADVDKALSSIQSFREETVRSSGAFEELDAVVEEVADSAVGNVNRIHGGMSRVQLILIAVVALFPLVAAAILGITAGVSLIVGPALAAAAGIEGIKTAFQQLQPEFDAVRKAIADTFERGLQPSIRAIAQFAPLLTEGLQASARGLIGVFNDVIATITSDLNPATILDSFRRIESILNSLSPAAQLLTQNLITLANEGLKGLAPLGDLMERVGVVWQDTITRLSETGLIRDSVASLFDIFASLLELIAGLTEVGALFLQTFGPTLSFVFRGLNAVLQGTVQILESLPNAATAAILALIGVRAVVAIWGMVRGAMSGTATEAAATATRLGLLDRAYAGVVGQSARAVDALGNAATSARATGTAFGDAAKGVTTGFVTPAVNGLNRFADTMRSSVPSAADSGVKAVSSSLASATSSLSRFFDIVPQRAPAWGAALRGAPVAALKAVEKAVGDMAENTAKALDSGINRGIDAFSKGWDRAGKEMMLAVGDFGRGLVILENNTDRVWKGLATGMDDFGQGMANTVSGINKGLTSLENSQDKAWKNISAGMDNAGKAIISGALAMDRGWNTAITGAAKINQVPTIVKNATAQAGTALSTGIAAGLRTFTTQLSGIPAAVTSATRNLGTAFATVPRALSTALGTLPTIVGGAARTLGTLGVAAANMGVAVAAGARNAAAGLIGALGGPWGLAITAAITALSLLASENAKTAAAEQEHAQQVQDLASVLRDSAGGISEAVRQHVALQLSSVQTANAMRALGLSAGDVSSAVISGGPAYDQLIAKLDATQRAGWSMAGQFGLLTRSAEPWEQAIIDQGVAAEGLIPIVEGLRTKFEEARLVNDLYYESLRKSTDTQAAGLGTTKALGEAFGVLKSELSGAEDKAKALATALTLLSGQTLPLTLAQGQLGESVRTMQEKFADASKAAGGLGKNFLTASGQINTASQAGYEFVQAVDGTFQSMTNAAAAAFEAEGGFSNLEAATAAANREAQFARDRFVELVTPIVGTKEAAEDLADAYGLIPSQVSTLLRAQGIPQVQQDLQIVQSMLQGLGVGQSITVSAITQEAATLLDNLGYKVETIPGVSGAPAQVRLTLEDAGAYGRLDLLVDKILHPAPGGPPAVPVTLDDFQARAKEAAIRRRIDDPTAPPAMPVTLNDGQVPGQVTGVQGQVTGAPAAMPTTLDTTKVQPQVDAIKQTVLTAVATLPINPIKGSGWDGDLVLIQQSVLLTVATMPINPIKGSGWDAALALILQSVGLAVAVLPIEPAKSISFDANLGVIRQSVSLPPYAILLIDVAKAPSFDSNLGIIRQSIGLPPYAILPIDAAKAPSFDSNLGIIRQSIGLPPYAILSIDAAKSINFDAQVQAIRDSLALTPAVLTITTIVDPAGVNAFITQLAGLLLPLAIYAELSLAVDGINQFIAAVMGLLVPIIIVADLTLAAQAVDAFAQAVSQMVIPIMIQPVFGSLGGLLGGAAGGIVSGGGDNQSDFDAASAASQRLTGGSSFGSGITPGGSGMQFNPNADLNWSNIDDLRPGASAGLAFGALLVAMAGGGLLGGLTPMQGGIAQMVPPNTWRVIGDRVDDDEAYIPINGSGRSSAILSQAAGRMGYGLVPLASGAITTQQTGVFQSAQQTTTSQSSVTTVEPGGGSRGNVYNFPSPPPGASAADLADEVMFRLRTSRYEGLHGGRR